MAPNKSAAPSLAKKAGGGKKAAAHSSQLPINHAQMVTLPDGSQVPVRIPPGMPAQQAAGIVEFLKSNPEAAKQAWEQAQAILQNPGLTNAMLNMQGQSDPTKNAAIYNALKDDPELQTVFEDVKAAGPAALQKYWDDEELMAKISAKLRTMQVGDNNAAGVAPSKGAGKPASEAISSLHEAAKWGDAEAAQRLLAEGADVNGPNERGISPLGVAVGFNRQPLVELLLNAGAELEARDGQGNTVLHYAAGYGRLELTELLLSRGASLGARNAKQQTPADVAKLNGEKRIVAFLQRQAGEEAGGEDDTAAASKADRAESS